jgi:hypothetical protein
MDFTVLGRHRMERIYVSVMAVAVAVLDSSVWLLLLVMIEAEHSLNCTSILRKGTCSIILNQDGVVVCLTG